MAEQDKRYDGCPKNLLVFATQESKTPSKLPTAFVSSAFSELPKGKKAIYLRIYANYRPQKEDPYRRRFTIAGNLSNYKGEMHTPTSAKILFNSVLLTDGAKFICIYLSNFYLIIPIDNADEFA